MNRQIFTALSLTLLISSPLTLNAGKGKKKKQVFSLAQLTTDVDSSVSSVATTSNASSSTTDLPSLALTAQASSATASSTQPDEFDPSNTAPQRALLFAAIVALEGKKNKGLKPVDCFHALQREEITKTLYLSESHEILGNVEQTQTTAATPAPQSTVLTDREEKFAARYVIAQWRLNTTKKKLAKTQEELLAALEQLSEHRNEILKDTCEQLQANRARSSQDQHAVDLFPSSPMQQQQTVNDAADNQSNNPTHEDVLEAFKANLPYLSKAGQQAHDDDFDKLSQTSNSDTNNNINHNADNNNNNNNNNNNCNPSASTSSSTPATATSGGWSVWNLLGYKK